MKTKYSHLCFTSKDSPNCNNPRNHKVDTITIHCYVGQVGVENALNGRLFQAGSNASCNYIICTDGRIVGCVPEYARSWCSSSSENDNRAITIECASDTAHPYAVNDKVMKSLIALLADISFRYGLKLKWSKDKNKRVNHLNGVNMTVHRDYAAKACPGEYLYNKMDFIASEVNKAVEVLKYNDVCPYVAKTTMPGVRVYNTLGGKVVRRLNKGAKVTVASVVRYDGVLYGKGKNTGQYFRLKYLKES